MDRPQYIALIPTVLYIDSEIIGMNTKWKSNSTVQAIMSIARVLAGMFAGKKVEVMPVDLQKAESKAE